MSTIQASAPAVSATRPAFDFVAGFAACSVFSALEMAGFFPQLEGDGLDAPTIDGLDEDASKLMRASLAYLCQRGLVDERDGAYVLSDYGRAVSADRGYMVWLVGGYGEPLFRLNALLAEGKHYGTDYTRDVRWVTNGTSLLARKDVLPQALEVLSGLSFENVVDFGCGNGRFLLRVCEEFGARGTGIDVSPVAVEEAEEAIKEAGLSDRVQVVLGDVSRLEDIGALDAADLVVTFFLLHEVLAGGRDYFVDWARRLSQSLPRGAYLLAGEIQPPAPEGTAEMFTPEFALVHALMRQRLLSAQDWSAALTEAGFEVQDVTPSGQPGGILILARNAR